VRVRGARGAYLYHFGLRAPRGAPEKGEHDVAFMQTAIGHLNKMFGDTDFLREHREEMLEMYRPGGGDVADAPNVIARNTERMLGGDSPLGESIRNIETSAVARVLQEIPVTILEAQRAVVHANLQREEPYGMTFAWAPGYDHSVQVWESPPTGATPGWITVMVHGRYPTDKHPITGQG